MAVEVKVDASDLQRFGRVLRQEADGKGLRRDLIREMRAAARPAVTSAKAAAVAIPSHGGPREGAPLRQSVAQQVRSQIRLSGRSTGVQIKVKKRNMPRGFKNAPQRLNRAQGWRHPVYGRRNNPWVTQTSGRPDWFDSTLRKQRDAVRARVHDAMERMAARLAARR